MCEVRLTFMKRRMDEREGVCASIIAREHSYCTAFYFVFVDTFCAVDQYVHYRRLADGSDDVM